MLSIVVAIAAGAADLPSVAAPTPSSLRYPQATAFLEREPPLRAWAVRVYDSNRDGWLSTYEAQPAMDAFKEIADSDRDGRITTAEYRRGIDFITARWTAR